MTDWMTEWGPQSNRSILSHHLSCHTSRLARSIQHERIELEQVACIRSFSILRVHWLHFWSARLILFQCSLQCSPQSFVLPQGNLNVHVVRASTQNGAIIYVGPVLAWIQDCLVKLGKCAAWCHIWLVSVWHRLSLTWTGTNNVFWGPLNKIMLVFVYDSERGLQVATSGNDNIHKC